MLECEQDLQMHVKHLRGLLPKIGEQKTAYFVAVLTSTKLWQMMQNMAGVFTHLL